MTAFFRALFGSKKAKSTGFSDFIRNASAGEKKRVYTEVLKKASERQLAIQRARTQASREERPQA